MSVANDPSLSPDALWIKANLEWVAMRGWDDRCHDWSDYYTRWDRDIGMRAAERAAQEVKS